MKSSPQLYLLDGSSYIYRAYYGVRELATSDGLPTNAIHGFTRMLLALIQEHRDGLLSFLEEEARRRKAHEESLAAGRIVPFPAHLVPLVHPSIRHLVEAQDPAKKGRNRHRNPELNQNT